MSIKKAFGGASIRKPGAYSITKVDNSGGAPLGANGTLFLIGEAETGAPGDVEGIQVYTASQLGDLVNEFTSGPLVDAAKAAMTSPSRTPGVGQADRVLIWKTNSSGRAQLQLSTSAPANLILLKDRNFGAKGNQISVQVANGTNVNTQRIVTIKRGDDTQILAQNAGEAQLNIQYTGSGTPATLTIGGSLTNKTLTTAITGDAPSNLNISLNDFASVKDLAAFIDAHANYTCTVGTPQTAGIRAANSLDPVTAIDILTSKTLYRAQAEIVENINENARLVMAEINNLAAGLPAVSGPSMLSGGSKGASLAADFSDGMAKSLSVDYGVMLPCISRDATEDIAANMTDASSTYDIDAVGAAMDSHLRLRGSVKNRKEAQGMMGYRDAQKADVYTAAQTLNSELIQMFMQDVLVSDINGNLSWKFPHIMAAMAAGIRLGTDIGEPLTHKFLSCNGIGHVVGADGLPTGDFDPNTDFDVAIDAGVTFAEQASGGFRIVVDNTTYGKDQSFVWNRGSVVEAAQYVAKTLRETAELVFVGQKVSNGIAASIKSVLRSKLLELNAANIITASDDGAPNGFREDTFTVTVQGNTAKVKVHVKPVQGLDFILIEFELGDITQSA